MSDFHNPYNFVPTLPRNSTGDLGDHAPLGHHVYHPEHYSGWIEVEMETVTPLLIPDAAKAQEQNQHKSFSVRRGADNKPYLPPTTIKGVLRSAYEAATNSRFGVFNKHDMRLGYRANAKAGGNVVPAVITGNSIQLMPGFTEIGKQGEPAGKPATMYAAWLPKYCCKKNPLSYLSGERVDGKFVYAEIELNQHFITREKNGQKKRVNNFNFWRVIELSEQKIESLASPKSLSQILGSDDSAPVENQPHRLVKGYVVVTSQNMAQKNMPNKHDERLFFVPQGHPQAQKLKQQLTEEHKQQWKELITNYRQIHEKEISIQKLIGPPALKDTTWSKHIYDSEPELKNGTFTFCYARLDENLNVIGLYPVMISRELFQQPPCKLLHQSLHQATSIEELSPADRVFGWINAQGKGAWKGQLRISSVNCETNESAAIQTFRSGLTLAILGQAKPEQARFYVAKDENGTPLKGVEKAKGYATEQQHLRGRKIYPHHTYWNKLADYWNTNGKMNPVPHDNKKYYREYIGGEQTSQNRTITEWIKPQTKFRFKIHITNLTAEELGGLFWLLDETENFYHRVGGGKPLGFGSVKLRIKEMELRDGEAWKNFYQNILSSSPALYSKNDISAIIEKFKNATSQSYSRHNNFDQVSFIIALRKALQGYDDDLPVHYPRPQAKPTSTDPRAKDKIYHWFGNNEQGMQGSGGRQHALPALQESGGLPYEPITPKK